MPYLMLKIIRLQSMLLPKEQMEHQNEVGKVEYGSSFMSGVTEWAPYSDSIISVRKFGVLAFKAPEKAVSLLTLGKGCVPLMLTMPCQINADIPRVSVDGLSKGVVLEIGNGRIAVFARG